MKAKTKYILGVSALLLGGYSAAYQYDHAERFDNEKTVYVAPTPQQIALTDYFQRKGSPHPERMATAVLETKKPRLLAAIASVESGGKETAKNRKSGATGAYQVRPHIWGRVPQDVVGQALQADKILDDLYDEKDGNLKKTLNAYGGDTKGKYAKTVLAELQNVPR